MLERGLPRDQLFQHVAADQRRIALSRIAPAAAGAAVVAPQGAARDHPQARELDVLDPAIAHSALANRDGCGLAILERPSAPAAALNALHHEAAPGLGMDAEEHDRAAEKAMVPCR